MNNLEQISKNFTEDYALVSSNEALNDLRVKYLGKTGVLKDALKAIKDIPVAEKKAYGESVNVLKKSIEAKLETLKLELENREIEAKLSSTKVVDLTIPSRTNEGSLHPVTIASHKVVEVFRSMGFLVEDGFEVETEYNNFEAVNIPKNHPARDMQDTFWLENDQVLRTHTSANQNRVMKKYGAPLRAIFPGRCYRNETLDASHDTTFWQLEGMVIDENISIANLIYFMKTMLTKVFGKEINVRLRPGFFPFTEPSYELDARCPFCGGRGCHTCGNSGWLELCPCGMIHPNVLRMGGIDPEVYNGFAFGMGFDRLVMIRTGLDDIRHLNSNNLKVMGQFKTKM